MNKPSLFLAPPRRILTGALICVNRGLSLTPTLQAACPSEQANIEVMIRKLNALGDSARLSVTIGSAPDQPHHFEGRLARDTQRAR
ncbi:MULTISPECIES: conjugal transfer protein [Pseudomonas]|uniref:conjugal transfer protein n=1 Tax=Pseudomonas TaxID=286 RepID=UPI000AF17AEA|nr:MULTISPECIES: conjugal transfer protein [Pseudomonas]MBA6104629.1 type III effector Hop protein [Pseudomonas monteilii]